MFVSCFGQLWKCCRGGWWRKASFLHTPFPTQGFQLFPRAQLHPRKNTVVTFIYFQACPSVRPHRTLPPTRRIFIKSDLWRFFSKNLSRKFKSCENATRKTGTWHEDQFTFMIVSRSILLTTRNVSGESCRETKDTNFVISNLFSKIVPFMR
jgi:hypothetical protein